MPIFMTVSPSESAGLGEVTTEKSGNLRELATPGECPAEAKLSYKRNVRTDTGNIGLSYELPSTSRETLGDQLRGEAIKAELAKFLALTEVKDFLLELNASLERGTNREAPEEEKKHLEEHFAIVAAKVGGIRDGTLRPFAIMAIIYGSEQAQDKLTDLQYSNPDAAREFINKAMNGPVELAIMTELERKYASGEHMLVGPSAGIDAAPGDAAQGPEAAPQVSVAAPAEIETVEVLTGVVKSTVVPDTCSAGSVEEGRNMQADSAVEVERVLGHFDRVGMGPAKRERHDELGGELSGELGSELNSADKPVKPSAEPTQRIEFQVTAYLPNIDLTNKRAREVPQDLNAELLLESPILALTTPTPRSTAEILAAALDEVGPLANKIASEVIAARRMKDKDKRDPTEHGVHSFARISERYRRSDAAFTLSAKKFASFATEVENSGVALPDGTFMTGKDVLRLALSNRGIQVMADESEKATRPYRTAEVTKGGKLLNSRRG